MTELEEILRECFGEPRKGGRRMAAVGELHAASESGFDVRYTRYSVTYRDARGEVTIGAELDEEGALVLHEHGEPRRVVARIGRALRFLGVALASRD